MGGLYTKNEGFHKRDWFIFWILPPNYCFNHRVWFFKEEGEDLWDIVGIWLGQLNVISLRLFILLATSDLESELSLGVWTLIASLVKISFSPKPSAAIKIKDVGHNFQWENTEHFFTKITHANIHSSTPPLSLFLTIDHPLNMNFFLSPDFHCH